MDTAVLAELLRSKRRRILWLGVGCVLSLVVAACSGGSGASTAAAAAAQGPGCKGADVPIGVVASLSGEYQPLGQGELGATRTAVATLGCFDVAGKSYKFKVYSEDDQGDPTVGTSQALGLIRQDHIVALSAGSLSSTAQTVVAQDNGIINFASDINVAAELAKAKGGGKYANIFDKSGYTSASYNAFAQSVIKEYPTLKSAVVLLPDNAVQYGVAEGQTAAFAAVGVHVSSVLHFAVGTLDFTSLLGRVRAAKPDMVIMCCDSATTAAVVKQAVGLGLSFKLFASPSSGPDVATSLAIGKPLPFPYAYQANPTDPTIATGPFLKYLQDFNKYSGYDYKSPGLLIGSADYASVLVLAKAMQRAGTTTDVKAISKAIPTVSVTNFTGQPFQYDSNHVAPVTSSACFVVAGKLHCAQPITAATP